MSESQKGTKNYSLPQSERLRKKFETTLTPQTIATLKRLAAAAGMSVGQYIESKLARMGGK